MNTVLPAAFSPHALSTKSATSTATGSFCPFTDVPASAGAGAGVNETAGGLIKVTGAGAGAEAAGGGAEGDEDAPLALGCFVRVFAAFFAGLGAVSSAFNASDVVGDTRLPDETN